MPAGEVKRIDVKEFREFGYLQEVNRRFLHPLGLALEVVVEDDGSERLGGIWDYRDDPEGIYFGEDMIDPEKAKRVNAAWHGRDMDRVNTLGFHIQPVNQPSQ